MAKVEFDPGYGSEPFASLCARYPGKTVYPPKDFRIEWGPIFHRGRLDGTSRVLVIGQDPAAHEAAARRILVGTAGHRVQGFLAKAGIDRSYTLLNTFLYSVYGRNAGSRYKSDPKIAAYRDQWFDALLAVSPIEAVVAFGSLAAHAWKLYRKSSADQASKAKKLPFIHVPHPTYPDSASGGDDAKERALTAEMLDAWNGGLKALRAALKTPDSVRGLRAYGRSFTAAELPEIPAFDLPAGCPAWMRGEDGWAVRAGATTGEKRRTLVVAIPPSVRLPQPEH